MKRGIAETIWGAVVLVAAVFFAVYIYSIIGTQNQGQAYEVQARFTAVDGIDQGSDVRIGGVKVGTVAKQFLDTDSFEAVLTLRLESTVKLPTDSEARITSGSLVGKAYVQLVPGGHSDLLGNGDEITKTKDVVALEELLGKLIFLVTEK